MSFAHLHASLTFAYMKLKNNYFILRHGQTPYQTEKKNRIVYPWPETSPIRLTEKGREQAKKAAKILSRKKIDLIFASDFPRTRQTAKIAAKEIQKKIHLDKRLRDIDLGIFKGKTKDEFYQDFPISSSEKRFRQKPLKGESWFDCKARMLNFLKEIDRKYKGKNILIVSHGDPLWLLEGAVKGWSIKKMIEIKKNKMNRIQTGELRELR